VAMGHEVGSATGSACDEELLQAIQDGLRSTFQDILKLPLPRNVEHLLIRLQEREPSPREAVSRAASKTHAEDL